MTVLPDGGYSLNIFEDGVNYYIGSADHDELGLYPDTEGFTPPTFVFENVFGADEYYISFDGKWVYFKKDRKLYYGDTRETWKLVPVGNIGYVIKGGPGRDYCWTLAAFAHRNLDTGGEVSTTCDKGCCSGCTCSNAEPCDKKDKGCPCGDDSATRKIKTLSHETGARAIATFALGSCTGCPSHCALVAAKPA